MIPPPYPRIAHLVQGLGTPDDRVLPSTVSGDLLDSEVIVEEKLDGANVSIWVDDDGRLSCATRAGPGARDRAGQLGPLRAWLAANDARLRDMLGDWPVVYAEWLLLAHSVSYDRLPSYLVVLDLWDPDEGFADVEDRDELSDRVNVPHPPRLWRGVPRSVERLEHLITRSAWGAEPSEGVIVRRVGAGEPRMAKLLRPGFLHLGDEHWMAGRPRNRLAGGVVSWR